MEIDYDGLRVLRAIVRTGSFEAAAKALGVTQSAVSQRIKQLEERTGSILITRGRPCSATADGAILCAHLENVSLLEYELDDRLSGTSTDTKGEIATIRLSVNSDSLATWFPEVIKRAANRLNIRVEIISDDQEFTEDRLRSGDASAVVTSRDERIAGSKNVPLGSMEYASVSSVNFFNQHFKEHNVTLERLGNAPALSFDRKDTLPKQWIHQTFGETQEISSHFIPSYEGLLSCCVNGSGWTMMPMMTVGPLLLSGDLIELVEFQRIKIPLYWQHLDYPGKLFFEMTGIVEEVAREKLC